MRVTSCWSHVVVLRRGLLASVENLRRFHKSQRRRVQVGEDLTRPVQQRLWIRPWPSSLNWDSWTGEWLELRAGYWDSWLGPEGGSKWSVLSDNPPLNSTWSGGGDDGAVLQLELECRERKV